MGVSAVSMRDGFRALARASAGSPRTAGAGGLAMGRESRRGPVLAAEGRSGSAAGQRAGDGGDEVEQLDLALAGRVGQRDGEREVGAPGGVARDDEAGVGAALVAGYVLRAATWPAPKAPALSPPMLATHEMAPSASQTAAATPASDVRTRARPRPASGT